MAGMGKVKALQIWCKNRVMGYRDVEITNMTSSWRDGMAFCALIHKFRPDLIDYDSLSKENVFENNELAFEVAEGLGIPALLDAEDMVKLEVPDKLSIITYVAQLHNYFKDKEPAGSPGLKSAAPKRHSTPVQRSVTMRSPESKRKPALSTSNKSTESSTTSPGAGICVACDGKVYLIEKHLVDGKLYHRSCYRRNNRSERPASVLISSSQTPQSTSTPLRPISTPPQSVSTPARPTATPPQSISTPLRPVSLASNGLKKPSTSLPSTPGTPPDTRPEWQRRIQDKSARRNVVGAINKTSGLAPLNENSSSSQTSTPVLPKTEAERVQLRSKAVDSVIRKSPLPRAVSVGVDLDERITKLRQLRASAKASGAPSSPALKARLEKLKDLSASGRLQVDSSSDKRSTQEKSNTKSENVGSKTEHPDTNSSNVGSKSERLDTSPSSSASKFDQSTSSLGSAVSKPVEPVNSVDSVGSQEEELRISEVVPTSSKIEDKEAADKQTTADAQGASVCSQTRDFGASEKENIPGDSDTLHTNRTSHSDTHEEVCSDSSAQVSADSKTTCVGIVHEQTDKTSVAGDQEDSVEMAATQSVKKSTNPFEDDSDDTSVPSHQVSSITEETIRLQISPPPLAPARHRRSAASKSLSSTNHSSAVTKSSPSATSAHKDTETTALPTRLSAGPSGITVSSHQISSKLETPGVAESQLRQNDSKEEVAGLSLEAVGLEVDTTSVEVSAKSQVSSDDLDPLNKSTEDSGTEAAAVPVETTSEELAAPEDVKDVAESDLECKKDCQSAEITVAENRSGSVTVTDSEHVSTEVARVSVSAADGDGQQMMKGEIDVAPANETASNTDCELSVEQTDPTGSDCIGIGVTNESAKGEKVTNESAKGERLANEQPVSEIITVKNKMDNNETDDTNTTEVSVNEEMKDSNGVSVNEKVKDSNEVSINGEVKDHKEVSSNGEKEVISDLPSSSPSPEETPDTEFEQDVDIKAGKPDRPSVSPAVARRLTNKEGDSLSTASTNTGVMSPHDTSAGTVVMRQKHASPKQPPHRPATAAAGSASKSHFYMDESHTEVREPPPKPARQSAIVHAVSKAKPGNWEDSLQSWSSKRKDRQRTTWYTTESYPTENNPFGEEEEEVEGSNVDQSSAATSEYDNSLNPFAEDDEEDDKVVVTSKPSESNNSSCEEPQRRKIIPTNPFEVSDDEEDVPTNRKKVIPEQELSSSSSINQSASKKANNVIVLPDTSNKRTTPKKKAAPPPPQQTTPISSQTPPTQTSPSNKSSSLQAPPTNQEDTNTEIFITNEEPINNELTNEEAGNAEVNRKKHRPAPPRPLPPKRRVQTEFGLDPEDIDRELASLDVKQQQLEERGRQLEQALRTAERAAIESNESINEDDELLTSWLETVNEKNQLVRRESELIFISKHHELETKQADIEYELRQIMHRAENLKSDEDKRREEELLSELVSVVHSRSQLVDKMDDERIRQQEEDVEINMALSATLAADKSPAASPVEDKKAAKKKTDKKKKKEKKPK